MKKIGLLINPYAKKSRLNHRLVEKIIQAFPNKTNVWSPTNLQELSQTTAKILEEGIEILFLFGGDGTFRATVQSFVKHHSAKPIPSFILLQGGTGNLYSKNYVFSQNPLRHLKNALENLEKNENPDRESFNILEVNDHYGFVFAVGGFSKIIDYYMRHKERSIALANWIIFKMFLSWILGTAFYKRMFKPFGVEIKNGSDTETMTLSTLSCSGLPIGYVLKPFHGVELNRAFGGILFTHSPFRVFLHLNSLRKKERVVSDHFQQFSANSLELFFSDPLQPMVDGDMLESTTKVTVKLGPQINLIKL